MKIVGYIALFILCTLLVKSTLVGFLPQFLCMLLFLSTIFIIGAFTISLIRKEVRWAFPNINNLSKKYLLASILQNITWVTIGACIYISFVPAFLSVTVYTVFIIAVWIGVSVLCSLSWVLRCGSLKSLNITLTFFTSLLAYQLFLTYYPIQPEDGIELSAPFKGDLYVYAGGNSTLINQHHYFGSQKYAMDIATQEDGRLIFGGVTNLKRYNTFGRPIYSPVTGVVVAVESSFSDQEIGGSDSQNIAGNHIVIQVKPSVFILMAHLKSGSVLVSNGNRVRVGQRIGEIGNSGNTTQPHLHMQAMTLPNFMNKENKGIPIFFKSAIKELRAYKRGDTLSGFSG